MWFSPVFELSVDSSQFSGLGLIMSTVWRRFKTVFVALVAAAALCFFVQQSSSQFTVDSYQVWDSVGLASGNGSIKCR